jgi:transglutaminase-like putative cysteine protease
VFGIQDDSEFIARVKAITNFTYRRSNCQSDPEPMRNGTTADWIAVPSLQIYGSCGDFSNAMRMFCKKVGLKARMVNLATARFANGSARFDTHVLVEVFDPDSQTWFLADPTFNLTFEGPSGHLLGLKELLKAAADGNSWQAVPVGPLRPGRTVGDYYLQYAELLHVGYVPPVPALGDLGVEFRTHEMTIDEMGGALYPATANP